MSCWGCWASRRANRARIVNQVELPIVGRRIVGGELVTRGAQCVEEFTSQNRRMLRGNTRSGSEFEIIVKVRRSGTWQASTNDGDPSRASDRVFWLFLDIEDGVSSPKYYVVPDAWIRSDILNHHAAYLEKHGGERPVAKASTHHAIQKWRLTEWRDRWDLLGL